MANWAEQVDRRAAILLDQMLAARTLALRFGEDPIALVEPYRVMLHALYEDELSFAHLVDRSDLVARFEGRAVESDVPSMGIVSYAFTTLREQVGKVARAMAGLSSSSARLPSDVNLGLSGLARGSLIVGVCVPQPNQIAKGDNITVFDETDLLYQTIRKAVKGVALITRYIQDGDISDELEKGIPDPAMRDAILVAAERISPTGKKGIDAVSLFSSETEGLGHPLTSKTRKALRTRLARPISKEDSAIFEGVVREIDLDSRRFEIRGVDGIKAIRCVYGQDKVQEARYWLDKRVKVAGPCEYVDDFPRLMNAESIYVIGPRNLTQEHLSFG